MTDPEGTALYFGEDAFPLFGWLHGSAASAGVGVVLCSPFGREEISAHRSWRVLAQTLARAGWPTLRFDLACTGDSAGDMLADDAPDQWRRSVHAAVDELRRLTGVARVVLVGLRSGALLAWQVVAERDDVAALACIAPVVSGRTWVRELKALEAASQGEVEASPEGLFESGGFALSEAARVVLSELDLRRSSVPKVPVLLIDRSEMPGLERWAGELAAAGVSVRYSAQPGFAELMLDPHRSHVPQAMWGELLSWLAALPTPSSSTPLRVGPSCRRHAEWAGVRESALDFAVLQGRVSAIVSRSASGVESGHTLVWLNAGATRRIGPSRMHVDLARHWARQGHQVVRLDLTGLGDSPALPGRPETEVYSPSAVREVCELVEQLRGEPGTRQIHVLGLCAGAYHGFKAAVRGAKVDSVVAINPLTFFWHDGMSLDAPMAAHKVADDMTRYRSGVFDAARWRKFLRGGVNVRHLLAVVWHAGASAAARPLREVARLLRLPVHDDLAAELRCVAARQVRVNFLIAEGDPGEVLLRSQAGRIVDRLARGRVLTIQHFDMADHVFTRYLARQRLFQALNRLLGPESPV
jgi:pimeloyl-ACP methyl ester carboxylesterase